MPVCPCIGRKREKTVINFTLFMLLVILQTLFPSVILFQCRNSVDFNNKFTDIYDRKEIRI